MHEAYPDASNLSDYIATFGIVIPAGIDYASKISSTIAEFESRTGWRPFLAGEEETRRFDPPYAGSRAGFTSAQGGRELEMDGGLIELGDDGVLIGVITGSSGTKLTLAEQFWLQPSNAAAQGLPYTSIRFSYPVRGLPQSISVTGTWGYSATVPDDVWTALLQCAASLCSTEISLSVSGGVSSIKDAEASVSFSGTGSLSSILNGSTSAMKVVVSRYRRIIV